MFDFYLCILNFWLLYEMFLFLILVSCIWQFNEIFTFTNLQLYLTL